MSVFGEGDWLPFYNINDDDLTEMLNIYGDNQLNNFLDINHIQNTLIFDQFKCSTNRYNSILDPDSNFFNKFQNIVDNCSYECLNNVKTIITPDDFSLCTLNVNSLSKNLDTFLNSICINNEYKLDLLSFCETKLTNDIENLYDIQGYQKITLNNNRQSGGLIIYVKNEFNNFEIRNDLNRKLDHIETLFTEIKIDDKSVLYGIVYRRPNTNFQDFLNEIEIILDVVSRENKTLIMSGDFNVNLLDYDKNVNVRNFVNLFVSHNLFSTIVKPTRVTGATSTLIDHIWTNIYSNCNSNGIFYDKITYHYPIFSTFSNLKNKTHNNVKSFEEIKFRNYNSVKSELLNVDWSLVLNSSICDFAYDNFITIFSAIFNKNFPLITKAVQKSHNKPYITQEIKELIIERNRLLKKSIKYPLTYYQQYKQHRNQVTKEIRNSRSKYFRSRLQSCTGDAGGTWKVINDVLKRNKKKNTKGISLIDNDNIFRDDREIANMFNEYFSNIGNNLSNKIENIEGLTASTFFHERQNLSIEMQLTNEREIVELVAELSDASAGPDTIPAKIMKQVINEIIFPITHICNISLTTGVFSKKNKTVKNYSNT